ncbi:hypothetical protein AHAS_Ahas07G0031800 [Arachis hypogaea]
MERGKEQISRAFSSSTTEKTAVLRRRAELLLLLLLLRRARRRAILFMSSIQRLMKEERHCRSTICNLTGKYKWQTYKEVYEVIQKVGSSIRSCGYRQGRIISCSLRLINMMPIFRKRNAHSYVCVCSGARAVEFIICHVEISIAFVEEKKIPELLKTFPNASKFLKTLVAGFEEGLLVSLDLASFEMVRKFKPPLMKLLESSNIDLCFANQDEATELLRDEHNADPVVTVEFLASIAKGLCHGSLVHTVGICSQALASQYSAYQDLILEAFLLGFYFI